METVLSDLVYGSVLVGVWTLFHPEEEPPPEIEVLEDFYYEIYGCEMDRDRLEDLVLPLPAHVFANLPPLSQTAAPVIDVGSAPAAIPASTSQAELFPPSLTSSAPPG